MQSGKIKLLIVDDHAILRQGLRRILDAESDMTVLGEASTGVEAVKKARQLKPDIVIMDITMPEQDGIESLRQIVKAGDSRVLILSIHLEQQLISEAVSAGAAGYLGKDSVDNELVSAVRTIIHGGTVFSANVSKLLAEYARNGGVLRSMDTLSPREREVFSMLAEGKTPTEIAKALFVSPKTIHTHRQHIMEKLGLRTATDIFRFALREGVIRN